MTVVALYANTRSNFRLLLSYIFSCVAYRAAVAQL